MVHKWLDSFKEQSNNQFQLKFDRQIGAEQEIHSLFYGVKGKIDSTVIFKDQNDEEKVTAVELKTGKSNRPEYAGQVRLYLMILNEVFSNPSTKHLLVYILQDAKNESVAWMDNECKGLIQNRNILCKYRKYTKEGKYVLPNLIVNQRQCQYCYVNEVCSVNAIAFNQVWIDDQIPQFSAYEAMQNKLSTNDIEYFK